jgi:hypothetical protein
MPGKAIIILAIGLIVLIGFILAGIFTSSNSLSKNMVSDYQKKVAYNIAQSGANLGLRKLRDNPNFHDPGTLTDYMGGKVFIRVFDTTINSKTFPAVSSTGYSYDGTSYTSFAFPPHLNPASIKGAFTSHSNVPANGNGEIDGRNYTLNDNLVVPGGTGTVGIWSTGTVTIFGSCIVGGTSIAGVDYAPSGTPDPSIILQNQTYPGGYPTTPDQIFGGDSAGFPAGTLINIAKGGMAGSQYIKTTTGSLPSYNNTFTGVTYFDLKGGTYSFDFNGNGILIINNNDITPLTIKNPGGLFKGIVVMSGNTNIEHLHGEILGAIITTSLTPSGNVSLNGGGKIHYSTEAIQYGLKYLLSGRVVWYEL